jgi:hypothetical protein
MHQIAEEILELVIEQLWIHYKKHHFTSFPKKPQFKDINLSDKVPKRERENLGSDIWQLIRSADRPLIPGSIEMIYNGTYWTHNHTAP